MNKIFGTLIDEMPMSIWIRDIDLKIIYANKKYREAHNKTKEEIIGLRSQDLYENEIAIRIDNYCRKVIESKEISIEEEYTREGYKQCSIIPIKNDDGVLIAIAGVVELITDYGRIKEKEYEIELQKNLTHKIIDILPGVIFYKDREGRYVYANRECKEFYENRGVYNIIGKTDLDLGLAKEQVQKFIEDDKNIIESKKGIFNETTIRDKNGSYTNREVVKLPLLDSYGNVQGIVGRSIDVTERKKYEEKLEYLSYTDTLTGAKNRTSFEELEKNLSVEENMPLGVIMGDADGLKLVNDTLGHIEGDNLLKNIVRVLKEVCEERGEVFRIGGDEFVILIPKSSIDYCEKIIEKINKKCKEEKNDLFNISISLGATVKEDINEDIYHVLYKAENIIYKQKLLKKTSIKNGIFNLLKIRRRFESEEIKEHAKRVSENAVKIGEKLGLHKADLDELRIAAELHDIGKMVISEEILLKPGPLTDKEYEIMKTHSEKGYRMVKASSELKSVAEIILYHHERYDGAGYPIGLKGEDIPLPSRIISVCDAYDGMISDRIYKKAMNIENALNNLKIYSGSQFDPKVVDAFIELQLKTF